MTLQDQLDDAIMMRDAYARSIAETAAEMGGIRPSKFDVARYRDERDRVRRLRAEIAAERQSQLDAQSSVAKLATREQ